MIKYLEIGFTDEFVVETMTNDDYEDNNSDIPVYNIYNQKTSDAKVKFRWMIDTSAPVIEHVLNHINNIRARPHLIVINIEKNVNQTLSSIKNLEKNLRFGFDYVSLIPIAESLLKLSDDDFDQFVHGDATFGDIYFKQYNMVANDNLSFNNTVQAAFMEKSVDNLAPGAEYHGFPSFYIDFPFYKIKKGRSNKAGLYKTWIEQNKSLIEEKGIDINIKSEVAFGQFRFAHFEGDTWELYQTVKSHPHICHISIFEE